MQFNDPVANTMDFKNRTNCVTIGKSKTKSGFFYHYKIRKKANIIY